MPRSIFVARITPTKVQVDDPDDVLGTHKPLLAVVDPCQGIEGSRRRAWC